MRIGIFWSAVTVTAVVCATFAWAGLPQTMNYQGYLTNASGTAVNTPTSMTFSLYSSNPHRNNPVWRETQPSVPVNDGIYNAQMGSIVPINAAFDVPYWLGIQVGADPEMTPLRPLATTGYAFTAQNVTGINPGNNFFIGKKAGNWELAGFNNTGAGSFVLSSNTTGNNNNAFGYRALQYNTEGNYNSAFGPQVLRDNTTGYHNTGLGGYSLRFNTTGAFNTASGVSSLYYNTTGSWNTSYGVWSLENNTTGSNNTAVGNMAGRSNLEGTNNIFIGYNSNPSSGSLTNAIAIGANAVVGTSNSVVLGGTGQYAVKVGIGTATPSETLDVIGTVKASQFIGDASGLTGIAAGAIAVGAVTDVAITGPISAAKLDLSSVLAKSGGTLTGPLRLPVNGVVVGTDQLVASGGRIGIGTATPNEQLELTGNLRLPATTATTGIIKSGGYTLIHSYGSSNFFSGLSAGNLTMTGAGNTANGNLALQFNTTGSQNTASGMNALLANTEGNENTANGAWSLKSNTTGSYNTAVGFGALNQNTVGSYNTASGLNSLYFNTSGSFNTATGDGALNRNTDGRYNTATGTGALVYNTTGTDNCASGAEALWNNTTGRNNTAVGRWAGSGNVDGHENTFLGFGTKPLSASIYNATAIGANAVVEASNHVRIGDENVTQIGGQVPWSNLSDRRIKKEIQDLPLGLDFVKALRPVQYKLKQGNGLLDLGFVAQDLEMLLGADYNILGIGGDAERTLFLRYTDFIAPMVKAIQEQQAIIENQKRRIESLEERLARIESLFSSR